MLPLEVATWLKMEWQVAHAQLVVAVYNFVVGQAVYALVSGPQRRFLAKILEGKKGGKINLSVDIVHIVISISTEP